MIDFQVITKIISKIKFSKVLKYQKNTKNLIPPNLIIVSLKTKQK